MRDSVVAKACGFCFPWSERDLQAWLRAAKDGGTFFADRGAAKVGLLEVGHGDERLDRCVVDLAATLKSHGLELRQLSAHALEPLGKDRGRGDFAELRPFDTNVHRVTADAKFTEVVK